MADSPAERAGLRAEDLVLAVDGEAIADIRALEAALAKAKAERPDSVVLFVRRGVATTYVELQPEWP